MKSAGKISLAVSLNVALLLAASSCSPIYPSIAKSSLYGPRPFEGAVTSAPSPSPSPSSTTPASPLNMDALAQISGTEIHVLDMESFHSELQAQADKPAVKLLDLEEDEIDELKRTRKLTFALESNVPSNGSVYFEVLLPKNVIEAERLSSISASLKRTGEKTWVLSIPKSDETAKEHIAETLLEWLSGVTIVFSPN